MKFDTGIHKDADSLRTARDMAKQYGFAPDYITRLAREGVVRGVKTGRQWTIDVSSFEAFLETQEARKDIQRKSLSVVRKREYQPSIGRKEVPAPADPSAGIPAQKNVLTTDGDGPSPVVHVLRNVALRQGTHMTHSAHSVMPVYAIHPGLEFLHKLSALMTSFVLVFGAYAALDREYRVFATQTLNAHISHAADMTDMAGTLIAEAGRAVDSQTSRAALQDLLASVSASIHVHSGMR